MPAIEIKKDIYWVGVIDWNLKNFHGYALAHQGTTYNAYLVLDNKVTLFDTVPEKFKWELFHQIQSLIDIGDIDYIVANHLEMDHSGALPFIMDKANPEKLFCSVMGEKSLKAHFHPSDWPLEAVKDGREISLGKRTVNFIETRMLHWPDSMFSYIPNDKLLISSDAFGQNIANSNIFDDQHDLDSLIREARHYFTNIILPYSPLVLKLLDRVQEAGLELDMIAPDHGMIWRSHPDKILAAYKEFASQKLRPKAVLVYDTMWSSTEKMIRAVADALISEGIEVRVMSLKSHHHSDVMGEFSDAAALVCGSPTHNNSMMPLMADFLTYMKGLKPKNRIGAALGSYGWSGEAPSAMSRILEDAGFDLPQKPLRLQYVPGHEQLAVCKELGRALAQAIKAKVAS